MDGRFVRVRVIEYGQRLVINNDWTGSVPTYYVDDADRALVVGTLEPAVYGGSGISAAAITQTGVVSLLSHGYYLGTNTLYDQLRTVPADARAEWRTTGSDRGSATVTRLHTVSASEPQASVGWDDLAREMISLTDTALEAALSSSAEWVIPLSGGLDSRLIAAAATRLGLATHTLTYGDPGWIDVIQAKRVATMLGVPWEHVPLRSSYLSRWRAYWQAWFGASLHVHGTYQLPLLERVSHTGPPVAIGFTGDPLGGAQTSAMMAGQRTLRQRFTDKWRLWSDDSLRCVLRFDPSTAFEELDNELNQQFADLDGEAYQRLWVLFQRNHVARFSSYQPSLLDTWVDTRSPFVNREMARFALSLPRAALDNRRLQLAAFRLQYPRLATIPGTYDNEPIAPSGRHYVRRTIADVVPSRLHVGPLREFNPSPNVADQRSLRSDEVGATVPIGETLERLAEWLRPEAVRGVVRLARQGSLTAMSKVQAVQALAIALDR